MATVGQAYTVVDSGWTRYDDRVIGLKYTGTWTQGSLTGAYLSTQSFSSAVNSTITFSFYGTKLRIIAHRFTNRSSNVQITIDGIIYNYSELGSDLKQVLVFEKLGLSLGTHTVEIKKITSGTDVVSLDAIEIDSTGILNGQIGSAYTTTDAGWTRYDDRYNGIKYTGAWTQASLTGGSASTQTYSNTVNNTISFSFYGTKLRIIASPFTNRSNNVQITIDGTAYYYSEYSATSILQALVFEKQDLSLGKHTVEIKKITTGTDYVSLDAIEIDSTGIMNSVGSLLTSVEPTWQRIDDTSNYISYVGSWSNSASGAYSGGGLYYTASTGKSVYFKFNGTKLRIIARVEPTTYASGNIVYIDENIAGTFTLVSTGTFNQVLVYEITGLSLGVHSVQLEKGTGTYLTLDAIEIDSTGSMYYDTLPRQLTEGADWKRLDYSTTYINFPSSASSTNASAYNGSFHFNTANTAVIKFTFVGSKIRLIGVASTSTSYSKIAEVFIDGVSYGTFSTYSPTANQFYSVFKEITGLDFTNHEVEIDVINNTGGLNLDCIDVDLTGEYITNVGTVLTSPQTGWKRYDNTDKLIRYLGNWASGANASAYGATRGITTANIGLDASYEFGFSGTKFRIISDAWSTGTTSIDIYIDGKLERNFSIDYLGTFIPQTTSTYQVLTFQKLGLTDGYHSVKVVNKTNEYLFLDAIDVDSTKELIAHIGLPIKTDINNMEIGDCIPCSYYSGTAGATGNFLELGSVNSTHLATVPASTSDGMFYFIKADRGLLIADRNVQSTTTWSTLNSAKYIEGFSHIKTQVGYNSSIVYVSTTGNDTNLGTITSPVLTISKAIAISKPNGLVFFGSGTFVAGTIEFGKMVTAKHLTYIGQGNSTTIVFTTSTRPYLIETHGKANFYNLKFTVNDSFVTSLEPRFIMYTHTDGEQDYKLRFYNCAFLGYMHTNATVYPTLTWFCWHGNTSSNRDVLFTNCSFNNKPAEIYGGTSNRFINCAFNTANSNSDTTTIVNSGSPITSVYNITFYTNFSISDATSLWVNKGTGTDPDGSIADLGVYGGTYAWATANWSQWQLTTLKRFKIRSMTGGHAYANEDGTMALLNQGEGGYYTDNEFDKYIANSTLNGRIEAGAKHVWGYAINDTYYGSWTIDTPHLSIGASNTKFVRARAQARSFNGSTSRANFNAVIIPTGTKTIQFEFDCSAIPTTARYVFTTAVKNESGSRIACYIAPTTDTANAGKLVITIDKGTGGASETIVVRGMTSKSLCDGTWYKVKFVFNDTTRKLTIYVNDVSDNEVNYETSQLDNTGYLRNLLMGADYATSTTYSGYLSGLLDNFRVYNSQNILICNCPMDEASSGTSITDTTFNGYIGTITSVGLENKSDPTGMYPYATNTNTAIVSGFRPVIEFEE